MQKLLLGTLLAGLAVSCAVGTEEPDTAGVLVDSSQEVEVPDWVTAAYLDLNKDGTVDILDLVIASKFMGQDVTKATEADAIAVVANTDESSPCGNMEYDPYEGASQFDGITVMDNTNYKKIFTVEEKKYVYALLVMVRQASNQASKLRPGVLAKVRDDEEYQSLSETQKEAFKLKLEEAVKPVCVAIRFLINDDSLPAEATVKVITGFERTSVINTTFVRTSPSMADGSPADKCFPGYCDRVTLEESSRDGWKGNGLVVNRNFNDTLIYGSRDNCGECTRKSWRESKRRIQRMGIPIGIGNDSVIKKLYMPAPPVPSEFSKYFDYRPWYLFRLYNNRSPNPLLWWAEHTSNVDEGIYINMPPDEVQRKYFPEDI